MLKAVVGLLGCLLAHAHTPWATCDSFSRFVECLDKDSVAYWANGKVVVLGATGKVSCSIKVKHGEDPAYVAENKSLFDMPQDLTGRRTASGEEDHGSFGGFTWQGRTPIFSANGNTSILCSVPIGFSGPARFGGVGVAPNNETVAVVSCPLNRTYLRVARFVRDHWTWDDTVPTPGLSMEGKGVLVLPRFNDVRFIGDGRIAFLAQLEDKSEEPKDTPDFSAIPLDGPTTVKSFATVDLLYCDINTGFCQVKGRFRAAEGQEGAFGFGVGRFTVSPDMKWLYIRTGDQIWRLSTED